jgi:medium-chain acyl-[acyl-carrier-protein] hydrolase
MQLMLPLLRADFQVCQTYSYSIKSPLGCPITAFGGLQDKEIPREQLEAWRDHTSASFSLRMLPGDHFFLHPSESILLQIISMGLHQIVSKFEGG